MSALLSAGLGLVSGIAGLFGGGDSDLKARQAASDAVAAQKAGLGFAMQLYKDWQGTYGQIEKQLSDYYSSNSGQMPMDVAAGIVEKAFRNTPMQIERVAEQRGLGEEQKGAMLSQSLISKAEQKAESRIGALDRFRQEKNQFNASGINAKNAATGSVMGSYQNLSNALTQQAAGYRQQATAEGNTFMDAISGGVSAAMALTGGKNTGAPSLLGASVDLDNQFTTNPQLY